MHADMSKNIYIPCSANLDPTALFGNQVRCVDTVYASDHPYILNKKVEFSTFSQRELTILPSSNFFFLLLICCFFVQSTVVDEGKHAEGHGVVEEHGGVEEVGGGE
jgi:hypothetical protein